MSDYAHWNEDAERIWFEENRYDMEHADELLDDDDDFDDYDGDEEEDTEEAQERRDDEATRRAGDPAFNGAFGGG